MAALSDWGCGTLSTASYLDAIAAPWAYLTSDTLQRVCSTFGCSASQCYKYKKRRQPLAGTAVSGPVCGEIFQLCMSLYRISHLLTARQINHRLNSTMSLDAISRRLVAPSVETLSTDAISAVSSTGGSTATVRQSDRWSLWSGDSFSPGIGNLSGKALLALGKAEIKAVRWVWARYRRRVIDIVLNKSGHRKVAVTGFDTLYDDLIDFSRYYLAV